MKVGFIHRTGGPAAMAPSAARAAAWRDRLAAALIALAIGILIAGGGGRVIAVVAALAGGTAVFLWQRGAARRSATLAVVTADHQRAREERFQALLQQSSDAIALISHDGTILYVSPAVERILGYSPDELVGKSAFPFLNPTDRSAAAEQLALTVAVPGQTGPVALRIPHRDGSERILEWVATSPIADPNAEEIIVTIRDVTERSRADAARAQLAAIVESCDDAIVAGQLDGIITSWNAGAERLYGYRAEEMIGKPISLLMPPGRTDEPDDVIARLLRGERISGFQSERLHKGGIVLPVVLSYSLVRGANGEIIGAASIARDITERLRTEEEVRYQAGLLDAVEQAIIATDMNGRIRYWNRFAEQLYGWPAAEVVGRNLVDVTPTSATRQHAAEIMTRLLTGQSWSGDFLVRRRGGASFPVHVTDSPIRDAGGRLVGVVGISVDATEQKRAEADQLQLERSLAHMEKMHALGQLAAGIAHDINNHLAAILGPIELLELSLDAEHPPTADQLQEVAFVRRAADDAARTVRRLLLFARRPAGDEPRQRVIPDDLLDDVRALTRPRWRDHAQAAGQRIDVICGRRGAPPVLADPAELREALVNLVNNAVDALPAGGTISLETGRLETADGLFALLTVRDDGTGIDAATKCRLFEPFFTTKGIGRGTGLGLAMVHGTVRRLGGTIEVESAPGVGTTVTIRLPADTTEAPTPLLAPAPDAPGNRHVLLVEDEAVLRDAASRLLIREGHRVESVASAEEAIERLAALSGSPVDMIICDVGLPGMSGWQLVDDVCERLPGLPVVLATGWSSFITDEELAAHHVSREHVLSKPYGLDDLRHVLATALATQ